MGRMLRIFVAVAFGIVIVALQATAGDAQECSHGKFTGRCRDISLIRSVMSGGISRSSGRSVLWLEQGYLSAAQAQALHTRIDKGIEDIEAFLGVKFDDEVYGDKWIQYFVHGRRRPSTTLTGSHPRKYLHPVALVSHAKRRRAPYLAQTVKIIAWDWGSHWLYNGLASHLNDSLGGYPAFPNFGNPLDDMAAATLRRNSGVTELALKRVGRNGVPSLNDRRVRRAFYVLSGSFAGHLVRTVGISKIMEFYPIKDTASAILAVTGKPVEEWKQEWIKTLER